MSRRTNYNSDGLPSSFGGNNQDHPTRGSSGPARSSRQTPIDHQDRYPPFVSNLSRAITGSRQTTYDSAGYPSSFGGSHQVHPAREPTAPANNPIRHRDPHPSPLSRTPERRTERTSTPHHDIWSRPTPIPLHTAPPRAPSYTAFGSSRRGEYNLPVVSGRPPSSSVHSRTQYHNPFLHPRGVESPEARTPTGVTPEHGMTPAHSGPPSPEREMMFPIEISGQAYGGNSVRRRRGGDDGGEKKE